MVEAGLFDRDLLVAGNQVSGPAIIVESETTTIVTSAFEAIMQSDRCLLVQRKSRGG
jgi:N-methylhydantoinase A